MNFKWIQVMGLAVAMALPAMGQGPVAAGKTSACSASDQTVSGTAVPVLKGRQPSYKLRRGDSFDLDFALSPEFNQKLAVQPDGYINLKAVNEPVYVEGMTMQCLTETLKKSYTGILHEPLISITLTDFEKPYFIASGQVIKPGKYDLRGPLTLTEAVALAGGFNDSAKHSQVVLFRPAANGMFETRIIDIKKELATRNLSEDPVLQPGDMLYVPQSTISKIRKFVPSSTLGAYYNPANF